jgi:hypothetical protein
MPAVTNDEMEEFDEKFEAHFAEDLNLVKRSIILRERATSSLPALHANALRNGWTTEQYRVANNSNWGLTEQLFDALHSNWHRDKEEEKPRNFWYHQSFDLFHLDDSTRGFDIDKGGLVDAASWYLGRPDIRSNRLDWVFLDAIIFAELEAYADHVFTSKAGTGINWAATLANRSQGRYYVLLIVFGIVGLALRYAAMPAIAYLLFVNGHDVWAVVVAGLWVLGLAWQFGTYPIRYRARRKARKLLQHLVDLHQILGGSTISPRKLKEALDKATTDGVVLDGAVFTIVDRIVARDPTGFIPAQVG